MRHFTPHQLPARPCWHCTDYLGLIPGGSAAQCARGGIRALPGRGCAFWVRETGADDEPEPIAWSILSARSPTGPRPAR
jgi:hypothetical protein